MNTLLIPKYGAVGACIGAVAAEFSVPVYQSIAVRKAINSGKMIFQNLKFTIYGVVMFVALQIIQHFMGLGFKTMVIQIVVGSFIYLGLSYQYIKKNVDIKSILHRKV